jgi:methionyl-tRNA formyltransferase
MNIVFAGTPAFAVPTLRTLLERGHHVVAVYTQPDRPAGRGRKLTASPVKQYALEQNLPVHQPGSLRGAEGELAALNPDAMVVVAYGLLLPKPVLAVPRYGCINVHASLLPRWRGAAPIARAIEAGDRETGVGIMQMEAGLDTGPVLLERRIPIRDDDTTATLEQRLALLGAEALGDALDQLVQGKLVPRPQHHADACYASKLQKGETKIDWSQSARQIHRKIRALNPWPVASTTWRGETLRLWNAGAPIDSVASTAPGTVIAADSDGIVVTTGDGALAITQLQAPGGKALAVREFLNGIRLSPGDRLGS